MDLTNVKWATFSKMVNKIYTAPAKYPKIPRIGIPENRSLTSEPSMCLRQDKHFDLSIINMLWLEFGSVGSCCESSLKLKNNGVAFDEYRICLHSPVVVLLPNALPLFVPFYRFPWVQSCMFPMQLLNLATCPVFWLLGLVTVLFSLPLSLSSFCLSPFLTPLSAHHSW